MAAMTIQEACTKLNEAIHQYANAAVLVDRDGGIWDADAEPFDKAKVAIRAFGETVLEEAGGTAEHFRMNELGTCLCRACELRARIAALGAKDAS